MADDAVLGFGITLEVDEDGDDSGYVAIANIIAASRRGRSRDFPDVTNQDSAGMVREFIMGLIDPGEIDVEAQFLFADNAGQAAIQSIFEHNTGTASWGTLPLFKLTVPRADGTTGEFKFRGGVQSEEMEFPLDAAQTYNFNIKVSGEVTKT